MALTVNLNGQPRTFELEEPASLAGIVAALALKPDRVAVEHNGELAPRTGWQQANVRSNDRLEVVHFVGGGAPAPEKKPLVVGIGGTTVAGSSTERALAMALHAAGAEGLQTRLFNGAALALLPLYTPGAHARTVEEQAFVEAIREASGIVIASPGYHGSVSGLVKNAIDLVEETARDARPYFDDLPVGLIATAYGTQAGANTIAALRTIVHSLRGWPTPFAATINSTLCRFDDEGGCSDAAVLEQLARVGRQVARGVALRGAGVL